MTAAAYGSRHSPGRRREGRDLLAYPPLEEGRRDLPLPAHPEPSILWLRATKKRGSCGMTETMETAKRNIIICCDGTGNEISENISNVLKLYRCLRKTGKTEPRQLVFYDPGVGTLARPHP